MAWLWGNSILAAFNMIPYGPLDGRKVKNWSAGCQVIWGGREQQSPFQTFMQDVELLVSENSNVYYTLVNSRDLPSIHNYYLGLGGEQ